MLSSQYGFGVKPNHSGKVDNITRRGKIVNKSFGVRRP
ncbi:MAG: 30S ribosomal protein THX, partial [Flavobacteriaceae bacterium]